MSKEPIYELIRKFAAPRTLVWRTWTDPALLSRWYGPNIETVIHAFDAKPGGIWLNEMKMGERSGYQRTEFVEVTEPEKLVCIMATTDENWNVTASLMMLDWPTKLLTTVTFDEVNGETTMRLSWEPHEASAAEIACFAQAVDGMGKGWESGMNILEEILAELQA